MCSVQPLSLPRLTRMAHAANRFNPPIPPRPLSLRERSFARDRVQEADNLRQQSGLLGSEEEEERRRRRRREEEADNLCQQSGLGSEEERATAGHVSDDRGSHPCPSPLLIAPCNSRLSVTWADEA